jgi:hypothetical protein
MIDKFIGNLHQSAKRRAIQTCIRIGSLLFLNDLNILNDLNFLNHLNHLSHLILSKHLIFKSGFQNKIEQDRSAFDITLARWKF